MASASQQNPNPAQSVHTPSASASADSSSSQEDMTWDDSTLLNIYIWDYCMKRGYSNSARELAEEAKLEPNRRPPIDAKQGLLYEWWSVFWVLFKAKSSNQGPEEAMVYTQSHAAQARMQSMLPRYAPNGVLTGVSGPVRAIPNALGAGANPHVGHPGQPPSAHTVPNGIGPAPPGQQQPGHPQGMGHHPQQTPGGPQPAPPLGFPAHNQQQPQQPQPNGVPAHGRPPLAGQGQPGRPQHMPVYPSPTFAHQQAGAATGPPPPYSAPGPLAGGPLQPNIYPPAHMRGMLPPGGPNGASGAASSPGFPQNSTGTGSRAPTPAQPSSGNSITNPSPSMASRTIPATPPNFGGSSGMTVPGGQGPLFDQANQLNMEIGKINPTIFNELRQELNLGNKGMQELSLEEKTRIVNAYNKRGAPSPSNPARNQQGRGSKRSSVSPSDEHAEIPTKEDGSPAQKKPRRSPEQPAPSVPGAAGTGQSQAGPSNTNQNPMGGMYAPNTMQNGMRPGGPQFTPQMAPMAISQGHPGMMIPSGAHMINQPMQTKSTQQYHTLAMHKMSPGDPQQQLQPMSQAPFGPDANQGRSAPQQFQGAQRHQGKMLPPSSPASVSNTNGQGKPPQNVQGKQDGKMDNVKAETSPRNGPPPPPSSGPSGTSPPTPVPGSAQTGPSVPSPSHTNQSRPTTSASNPPSGGASSGPGPAPATAAFLPTHPASAPPVSADTLPSNYDFMNSFDDFTAMFGRGDGLDTLMPTQNDSLDFASEYGNWLNGDSMLG